ncbi:uncharacterized protein CCOS01_12768 [Colletotrichum costaricense]|uniref:Uncharacterized protein n=1 Tax=Colletotrichum costaricense TaxID=1209916 RepID=A0AAJ0DWF5_9PEZI|nr:uncharacterized protein CCOS01_12768 [Colletotrichum costaricense]KAK1517219.1 hypothetical protein CCOS01_12768 [Colletotrichum costaricense]
MVNHWRGDSSGFATKSNSTHALFDGVRYMRQGYHLKPGYKGLVFYITDEEVFEEALNKASQLFGARLNISETPFLLREGTTVNRDWNTPGMSSDYSDIVFGTNERSQATTRAAVQEWRESRMELTGSHQVNQGNSRRPRPGRSIAESEDDIINLVSEGDGDSDNESGDRSYNGDNGTRSQLGIEQGRHIRRDRDNMGGASQTPGRRTGGIRPAVPGKAGRADGGAATKEATQPGERIVDFKKDIEILQRAHEGLGKTVTQLEEGRLSGGLVGKAWEAIRTYLARVEDVSNRMAEAVEKQAGPVADLDFLEPDNFLTTVREADEVGSNQGDDHDSPAPWSQSRTPGHKRRREGGDRDEPDELRDDRAAKRPRPLGVGPEDDEAIRAMENKTAQAKGWEMCASNLGSRLEGESADRASVSRPSLLPLHGAGEAKLGPLWAVSWNGKLLIGPKVFAQALRFYIENTLLNQDGYRAIGPLFIKKLLQGERFPICVGTISAKSIVGGPGRGDGDGGDTPSSVRSTTTEGGSSGVSMTVANLPENVLKRAIGFWEGVAEEGELRQMTVRVLATTKETASVGGVANWYRLTSDVVKNRAARISDDEIREWLGIKASEVPQERGKCDDLDEEEDWDASGSIDDSGA